jgi:hypothetical protein
MNLNFILSALTGTGTAVAQVSESVSPDEPMILQILKLVLPSLVSIATYYISHHVGKRRSKNNTYKK